VVAGDRRRPVRVDDIGRVRIAPAFPRGAAAIDGREGVLLEVFKQPDADTLEVTAALDDAIHELEDELPAGVVLRDDLFRQATFLQRGVDNVIEALRDGAVLVVLVILLFLLDVRASLITLVALPLSFATAGILFSWLDLTLNTMTLGGLAIAVGELVDDAIVGVENVVRRLREKGAHDEPAEFRCLVAEASSEVRGPIFTGTLVVVLVFVPLFALSGIEGRLFSPLALAYVVALLASMVVSLTITPALAAMLLHRHGRFDRTASPVLRGLQFVGAVLVRFSVRRRAGVLAGTVLLIGTGVFGAARLGSQFLPAFDEGTVLVMTFLPPGTSLEESVRVASRVEQRLEGMPGVISISRITGRGEHDEHAPPVGISHLMLTLDPEADITRDAVLGEVRQRLSDLRGVDLNVGQPLAHRIDHLLSGVQAQIAVKIRGEDLDVLRNVAGRVEAAAREVPGVADLYVEPQVLVPQVHVEPLPRRLQEVGLTPGALADELEVAIGGRVVGQLLQGERSFDLFVRLDPSHRGSVEALGELPIGLPAGGWARLGEIARVGRATGPNRILRDDQTRRIAVSCNTAGRSTGEVVEGLREVLAPVEASLPDGFEICIEGQYAAHQAATRLILGLSLLGLLVMIMLLYGQFGSFNLALQVLVCIPAAFLGGVGLLLATGQPFSVAALVGFVSLAGIATRNGILLMTHYLHLARAGRDVTVDLLVRAGRERAAPVVMTALTTGAGLLPLLLAAGETGREILYPVATVVIGGLVTSTLFEFTLRPALFWTLGRRRARALANPAGTC